MKSMLKEIEKFFQTMTELKLFTDDVELVWRINNENFLQSIMLKKAEEIDVIEKLLRCDENFLQNARR